MKLQSLLAILPLACAVPASAAPLSSAAMQEDVRYLRDVWSQTDRSLDDKARRDFDAVVDAALARVGTLRPEDFALEVSRAVATANNAHTKANIGEFLHGMPV